jgi:hypothetical protein
VLFREDSFALRAVSRLLFGNLGRKYLDRLVAPLIKNVLEVPEQMDVSTITIGN